MLFSLINNKREKYSPFCCFKAHVDWFLFDQYHLFGIGKVISDQLVEVNTA